MAESDEAGVTEPGNDDTKLVEFGASLREMRLAYKRELSDVADDLRIRLVYLQAIEDGRFDDLPGPTYAIGFVRAYATYLGLDVNEVAERFRAATGGVSKQANLVPPSPVSEGGLPTGSVLLVAAILAVGAYGGWYYLTLDNRDPGDWVAALPQRIASLVGMNAEPDEPSAETEQKTGEAPGETGAVDTTQGSAESGTAEATPETAPADAKPETAPAVETAAVPAPEPAPAPIPEPAPEPVKPVVVAPEPKPAPEPEPVVASVPEPAPEPVKPVVAAPAPEPEPAPAPKPVAAPEPPPQPEPVKPVVVVAPEPVAAPEPPPQPEPVKPVVVAAPEPSPQPEPVKPVVVAAPEPPPQPEPVKSVMAAPKPKPEPKPKPKSKPAPVVSLTPAPRPEPVPQPQPAPAQRLELSLPLQTATLPKPSLPPPPKAQVVLRATSISWVEVNERSGKEIYARLMYPGDTFKVPSRLGLTFSTGNAGGIDVLIDGKILPPLGPAGAVRRDVLLDAKSLLANAGAAR